MVMYEIWFGTLILVGFFQCFEAEIKKSKIFREIIFEFRVFQEKSFC